ncbi:MAG: hypothetical protein DIU71_17370, partial [Proteobacteria bacterium]
MRGDAPRRAHQDPTGPCIRTPASGELREDVDHADGFEHQQHQEHDAEHLERASARRQRVDPFGQGAQLGIGQALSLLP